MNHPRECHTGWDGLLDELERHLYYLSPAYETLQIKEKFGGLRYYATYVPSADDEPYKDRTEVAKQIFHRLIDETERRSFHHCERCGEKGRLIVRNRIYMTRCETCEPDSPLPEDELPIDETLDLLADIMDEGAVDVKIYPHVLREASETIRSLRVDAINIVCTDGEHLATIEGDEATHIMNVAVEKYVREALMLAIAEHEGKQ